MHALKRYGGLLALIGLAILGLVFVALAFQVDPAAASEDLTIREIHQTIVTARSEVFGSNDIACVTFTKRETKKIFSVKGTTFFCVEGYHGEIVGAVVNKKGKPKCQLHGFFDFVTGCMAVESYACGFILYQCP
jgi:hypothetical protein